MVLTKKFSLEIQQELEFYVYALVSPLDSCVFYIGKGKGNRVFEHELMALDKPDDKNKNKEILKIRTAGKEVLKYIISYGLTEKEALMLENGLIAFCHLLDKKELKLKSLTNIVSGHRTTKQKGKLITSGLVDDVIALLAPTSVPLSDLGNANIMFVKVNPIPDLLGRCEQDLTPEKLLKPEDSALRMRTLGNWVMNKEKADNIEYILGVYPGSGMIVSAFKIGTSKERYKSYEEKYTKRSITRYNFYYNAEYVDEINGVKLFPEENGRIQHIKITGTKFVDENGQLCNIQSERVYSLD